MPKRTRCRCCCEWILTVKDCFGNPLDGFTVTISQGGDVIDTAVSSDGSDGLNPGQVRFKPESGTYTVTTTPPDGSPHLPVTQTVLYTC
ncbi:hypothetical protein [Singulisphaera sp. PoT]|uniref:hypothetical protein n=1 Tax=Singulisphaera sp. PoT TaxID=3411797 RepID=UPI003BF4C237